MRRALVTGGNRGIGFAIAESLVAKGYEVLIGSRDLEAGEKAAKEIAATALELDVANPKSITQTVKAAGPVDVL
ncbi:MAG: SDR family NAD(P)-dependent oxidoreductase, partial [Pseudomonadota bacterium]